MDKIDYRERKLKTDYSLVYKYYGHITVPKGTRVDNRTASGLDNKYNFIKEYDWITEKYPTFANILKHDIYYYGINVPLEYLEEIE